MRNKSAFTKPTVQESFRKSQRFYPDPTNSKNYGSLTKKPIVQIKTIQSSPQINPGFHSIPKNNKGQWIQKYHMYLQNPFPITKRGQTIYDNYCIWFRQLENSVYKKTERSLHFINAEYIVSNWTDDQYPSLINICIQDFYGYLDENGQPTDRIAVLQIQNATAQSQLNSLTGYQLRYKLKKQAYWDIPSQKTELKFYLTIDRQNTKIQLPISNPLVVNIQILFK